MRRNLAYAGAIGLVLGLGLAVLGLATDGWRAITAEEARRVAARENPATVPPVALQDARGGRLSLDDAGDRWVVLDFIYTGCQHACTTLGASFRRIQEALPKEALGRDVVLISVTFDMENDDAARLVEYGDRFGADPHAWRLTRPAGPEALETLLDHFQVVVIPDGREFVHNSAIYVVDPDNRLSRIFDIDRPGEVVAYLEARL